MDRSRKQPKYSPHSKPSDREVRIKVEPDNCRKKKPAWNFRLIDHDCPWDFKQLSPEQWWDDVLVKLKDFETMTWQEIVDASGGRTHGNNNHEVPIPKLATKARKRLKDLKLDDISSIYSLRLTGQQRIWGILEGNVLKIMWFDPDHEVCPSLR